MPRVVVTFATSVAVNPRDTQYGRIIDIMVLSPMR